MNGNPNAAQKRFHTRLREMNFNRFGGRGELHHIFGSKFNRQVWTGSAENPGLIVKPGEWLVILLSPEDHFNIKDLSFEEERDKFLAQEDDYFEYFNEASPVPGELVDSYKEMLSKFCTSKKVNKFL